MIELFTAATPNGVKISIALEELGVEYTVRKINFNIAEQKEDWFLKQAEAMDMIVDEELLASTRSKSWRNTGDEKTYQHFKMELHNLLQQKLF